MTLYNIFRYTTKEITEIEYLIGYAYELGIEDRVQETLYQFSPKLVEKKIEGFGEHETWFNFHKRSIQDEIVFFLIDSTVESDYTLDDMVREQVFNSTFTEFVETSITSTISKKEIIAKFNEYVTSYIYKRKTENEV